MKTKEKFNIGDLCVYRDMYVLILSKRKDLYYELFDKLTDSTSITRYDVLFPGSGVDTVSSSCLKKIQPAS